MTFTSEDSSTWVGKPPTATDDLLHAWRKARDQADSMHRRALEDADKIYKLWQEAQKDEAVRGAALPTATWQDRLAAIQALGEATLGMRKPGDWYVSVKHVDIGNGHTLRSGGISGRTPEEAVEQIWREYTNLAEGEYLAVGWDEERMNAVWDGDAWKTWKPQRPDAGTRPYYRPSVGDRVEVSYLGTGTVVRLWDDGNVQVQYDPGQYERPDGLPVTWSGPPSLLTQNAPSPLRSNDD